jgi:hypothetical protein
MRYRPIQAASRERVPFTLWGRKRMRSVLAAAAASAVALVPVVMVASPAQAAAADTLVIADGGAWEGDGVTFKLTYTGTVAATFTLTTPNGASATAAQNAIGDATPTGAAAEVLKDFKNNSWTVNGTAGATTVTFAPASASSPSTATVTVATVSDDDLVDQGFMLTATNTALNGGAGDGSSKTANGLIWAYGTAGAYPTYTLRGSSAAVAETATKSGSTTTQKTVTLTAALSNVLAHPVTIPVATIDGTAKSTGGEFRDYDALPAGTAITIPAYSYTGTVDVTLWDDALYEDPTQSFTVAPSTSVNYGPQPLTSAATQTPTVTIKDDEPVPTVSIADAAAAAEGDYLQFPVSLSGLSELQVSVTADTADGSVRSDSNPAVGTGGSNDYTPLSQSVVIAPYTKSRNFSVTTTTNGGFEGPENVKATISGTPTNATLGTPTTAYGVINDGPDGPEATLDTSFDTAGDPDANGNTFVELASGEAQRKIGVTLDAPGPWQVPVKIDYAFKDGTATNGVDYKGTSGSITIPAGTTPSDLFIPVTIVGDTIKEGVAGLPSSETFSVVLSSTTGTIDPTGLGGTIEITEGADDQTPTWSVGNASVVEGNTGTATAKVPVTLSAPAAGDTTFSIGLTDGTTTETGVSTGVTVGANDYDWPANRTLTIAAGSTTGYIEVPVNADTVWEQDETVVVTPSLTSSNISNTTVTGTLHSAALTITNDDVKPSITFNNLTGGEGSLLRVNGTINGLSQYDYKLGFAIAAGTPAATPGKDFDAPANIANWSLNVARGTAGSLSEVVSSPATPFTFDVYLTPDTIDEATESFTLTATETTPSPTGFMTSVGTYKITDDPADMPPAVSVRDESIGEDEGSVDVHVDLTQVGDTTATEQAITIPYWTVDGSAKAGQDYAATKGTLTIDAGVTSSFIKVPVINDKVKEGNENFWVKLGTPTSPTGATIAKGAGEVIIKMNDGGSGDEPGEPNEPEQPGAPTISAPAKIVGAVAVPISGQAASGATVELWGAPMGGGDLKFIGSTKANAQGRYSFSRWIGVGHRFATQADDLNSEEVTVTVQQNPVFAASSPARGKLALTVTGNPRAAGQTVIVQRWVGGKWVNAWRGTTGNTNQWRATINAPAGSAHTLRAFIAGHTPDGLAPGYSVARKVTIRR